MDICRLDLIHCLPLGTNARRNSMGQGVQWWCRSKVFLQLLIHQRWQTWPPMRALPAAEQRQVWRRSPSLGPWHPALRSTDRVGSVGQVGTGKINGAGAGWVGQSPGLARSLLEMECPTQAKNQPWCHSSWPGLDWSHSLHCPCCHLFPSLPRPPLASFSLWQGRGVGGPQSPVCDTQLKNKCFPCFFTLPSNSLQKSVD